MATINTTTNTNNIVVSAKEANKLVKEIMQVWKTVWIPVYGDDFKGFCEFVFDRYGIDMATEYDLSEFDDINHFIKERKTIKNILTVREAISADKSSKNHKLKPRETKRDKTKRSEAKRASRVHKESLKIKFDV